MFANYCCWREMVALQMEGWSRCPRRAAARSTLAHVSRLAGNPGVRGSPSAAGRPSKLEHNHIPFPVPAGECLTKEEEEFLCSVRVDVSKLQSFDQRQLPVDASFTLRDVSIGEGEVLVSMRRSTANPPGYDLYQLWASVSVL